MQFREVSGDTEFETEDALTHAKANADLRSSNLGWPGIAAAAAVSMSDEQWLGAEVDYRVRPSLWLDSNYMKRALGQAIELDRNDQEAFASDLGKIQFVVNSAGFQAKASRIIRGIEYDRSDDKDNFDWQPSDQLLADEALVFEAARKDFKHETILRHIARGEFEKLPSDSQNAIFEILTSPPEGKDLRDATIWNSVALEQLSRQQKELEIHPPKVEKDGFQTLSTRALTMAENYLEGKSGYGQDRSANPAFLPDWQKHIIDRMMRGLSRPYVEESGRWHTKPSDVRTVARFIQETDFGKLGNYKPQEKAAKMISESILQEKADRQFSSSWLQRAGLQKMSEGDLRFMGRFDKLDPVASSKLHSEIEGASHTNLFVKLAAFSNPVIMEKYRSSIRHQRSHLAEDLGKSRAVGSPAVKSNDPMAKEQPVRAQQLGVSRAAAMQPSLAMLASQFEIGR